MGGGVSGQRQALAVIKSVFPYHSGTDDSLPKITSEVYIL